MKHHEFGYPEFYPEFFRTKFRISLQLSSSKRLASRGTGAANGVRQLDRLETRKMASLERDP